MIIGNQNRIQGIKADDAGRPGGARISATKFDKILPLWQYFEGAFIRFVLILERRSFDSKVIY